MSPTLTIIKATKPEPKKRGPKPGTKVAGKVEHVCPSCGIHFTATAKRVYHNNRCQEYGRRRRLGIPERKRRDAISQEANRD